MWFVAGVESLGVSVADGAEESGCGVEEFGGGGLGVGVVEGVLVELVVLNIEVVEVVFIVEVVVEVVLQVVFRVVRVIVDVVGVGVVRVVDGAGCGVVEGVSECEEVWDEGGEIGVVR